MFASAEEPQDVRYQHQGHVVGSSSFSSSHNVASRVLHMRGLPFNCQEQEIVQLFQSYTIDRILMLFQTNQAFVQFLNVEDSSAVLNMYVSEPAYIRSKQV